MTNPEEIKVTIRPAENNDIRAILKIYDKVLEGSRKGERRVRIDDKGRLTYEEIASTGLRSTQDLSLVAEVEGQVSGFIWSRLCHVGIPVEQVVIIHMLIVDPEHQRLGIARQLINRLADRCRDKGVNTLRAVLEEHNADLENFFTKQGFHYSGVKTYSRKVNVPKSK